jgi:hypothetical protein
VIAIPGDAIREIRVIALFHDGRGLVLLVSWKGYHHSCAARRIASPIVKEQPHGRQRLHSA